MNWRFALAAGLWLAAFDSLHAQAPFTVDARGPYRAGEWLALALDPKIAATAAEIAIYPAGEDVAITSFQASAAHSVAPLRFPLLLDSRGRYDVRIRGEVVQHLVLDMRNAPTWPARTWLPTPQLTPPQSLWECGAWNAAYAPAATDPKIVEASRLSSLLRRLPAEPLALGPLPARWFLDTVQPGHLIAGGLAVIAVAAMALSRRRQAILMVCAAAGATALQFVAPERIWPLPERFLVWNLWARDGGADWQVAVDEILQGEGSIAFAPDCVIEPLAGGAISACRFEGGTWHADYRGGVLRRWFPAADEEPLGDGANLSGAFRIAGAGVAFRGWHFRGEVADAEAFGIPSAAVGEDAMGPRSLKRVQLDALARAYAAAGERVLQTWKSRRSRIFPSLLRRPLAWMASWGELAAAAAEAAEAADVPNDLLFKSSGWFLLESVPHHPFGDRPTRAYLRVVGAEP